MRLLVVEDEVRLASLIKRGLEEEGYEVDVAHDGEEALWYAAEDRYGGIVLDVMIPPPDGLSVCRQLRAQGRWMPILMLTAKLDVADRVAGLDAGADDYLGKPFSFAELAARLRALVRRRQEAEREQLLVGDLFLDPALHEVRRGDVVIDLSPKEFDLLEFLMRHPDQLVSRQQILDHVWDFAYDGTSNVVDQYMSYLRRKIDRPFDVESLMTIRGVGYRLRATRAG